MPAPSPSPGERWSQQVFVSQSGFSANIRSPTATYPTPNQFMQFPLPNQVHPYRHNATCNTSENHSYLYQGDIALNPPPNSGINNDIPRSGSPNSPTSPEGSTNKKKRKRADAYQLKILNETYARTAFPTTEERIALAKLLNMSARSVQIWRVISQSPQNRTDTQPRFQNRRQSMRQTNRQSATSTSHHHSSISNLVVPASEGLVSHPSSGYDTGSGSHNDTLYLPSPQTDSRAHNSRFLPYGNHHSSTYRHRD